jgi:hypothetical protein
LILFVLSSDLPGVKPAALNGMILYYRLMTKWSGLGDSTELSRMGLSHEPTVGVERGGERNLSFNTLLTYFSPCFQIGGD